MGDVIMARKLMRYWKVLTWGMLALGTVAVATIFVFQNIEPSYKATEPMALVYSAIVGATIVVVTSVVLYGVAFFFLLVVEEWERWVTIRRIERGEWNKIPPHQIMYIPGQFDEDWLGRITLRGNDDPEGLRVDLSLLAFSLEKPIYWFLSGVQRFFRLVAG